MSIPAFTNAPGTHTQISAVQGRQRGMYFNKPIDEVIYTSPFHPQLCSKNNPTPGYGHCTTWSRSVRQVTVNEPAQWHRRTTTGNPPNQVPQSDYTGDRHISLDHDVGSYIIPDPGVDNARSKSITTALNNLTQHYAGIGADLAQYRQTCDDFAGTAVRALSLLKAIRDRRFGDAWRQLYGKREGQSWNKTLADLWLQYSYGWKPLASDLYELHAAAVADLKKPVVIKATGHGLSSNSVRFNWNNTYWHEGVTETSFKTRLYAGVSNPYIAGLSNAGLINPLSIAWEVVPFSFVLDWIIPIGNTLQAITAGVGLNFIGGYTSNHTKDHLTMYRSDIRSSTSANDYWWEKAGSYQEMGFSFHRQCHASLPMPELYANVTPYSTPRALNAIALLHNL